MGKVVPITVNGHHTEKSESFKKSATEYLANELTEIIGDLEANPGGSFNITIEIVGYPPELIERIRNLLQA